ncbi:putative Phage integrase [Thiomonas arsenitoxydans]|uniref:Phage integrase n=1 Tax=Thiomonas arsenitoxydans (strain DSM 22701 / CIP 110005 / 3As) TaxID=426114 RepID=D6CPT0_THIA3|nr:site-specific integrase [Thiomonas arsenitoxydans]CAZ88010.1 putative Phage integrase [Thiomonas arsenitoxydans]CQR31688.1 putative Phage integrase [Thiomonas arsenitoxydans]CQR32344.1 putative Phage integrase [Thiomonas arsenitoxydans]CQR34772.1 putative Phage integrase [Thiomonas arsenitoxydans]CQR40940.1 putative Phage integrase [Thiomonas arsenitoxydans]
MKPFQIKGRAGWHAEVHLPDGRTACKKFQYEKEARAWLSSEQARVDATPEAAFGGPARVTLGALLVEYAQLKTLVKDGFQAEIDRINHYITAAGYPALAVECDAQGRRSLCLKSADKVVPAGWQRHLDARLAKSARTYAKIHALGATLCSRITTADMEQLKTTMLADGLSESTVQKEIALLKSCFNVAITTWKWTLFENPCVGVKLRTGDKRFVTVGSAEIERLVQALSECDNPQIWPLVELAMCSAMRKGSLLKLRWDKIDFEGRKATIWAKGRLAEIPLSRRSVEVLARVPRLHAERVFPLRSNAVDMAWDGVRIKAGLPTLPFRDLRHIAPTYYARKGATVTAIKHLLGHTSTRMAEVYVDMTCTDVVDELDRLDAQSGPGSTVLPPQYDPQGPRKHPRARRRAHVDTSDAQRPAVGESLVQRPPAPQPAPDNIVRLDQYQRRSA